MNSVSSGKVMSLEEENRQLLKEKIEEELVLLANEIERLGEQIKPIAPDSAIGRLTRMEAIQSKSITEATLRKAQMRERKLKTALKKVIEDPSFGICQDCEEAIPVKRMLLMPESTKCVPCASPRYH